MSAQSTKKQTGQQPTHKAVGLLASCAVVVFGGWIGLRPETILVRALVVGFVTAWLVKIVLQTVKAADDPED